MPGWLGTVDGNVQNLVRIVVWQRRRSSEAVCVWSRSTDAGGVARPDDPVSSHAGMVRTNHSFPLMHSLSRDRRKMSCRCVTEGLSGRHARPRKWMLLCSILMSKRHVPVRRQSCGCAQSVLQMRIIVSPMHIEKTTRTCIAKIIDPP